MPDRGSFPPAGAVVGVRGKDEVRGPPSCCVDLERRIRLAPPLRTIWPIVNAVPTDMSAEFNALDPPRLRASIQPEFPL